MEEARAREVCEKLTKFRVNSAGASQYLLWYRQESSPEFRLTVQQNHAVLSPVLYSPRKSLLDQLRMCAALNSASLYLYAVIGAEGLPEVHCSCFDRGALDRVVDQMAKWYLRHEASLLGESEALTPGWVRQLTDCFMQIAAQLQVTEYTLSCESSRVRLQTALHFRRRDVRYLSIELRLLALSEKGVSVRVRSCGSCTFSVLPGGPLCLKNGRLVLNTNSETTSADAVRACVARTVASFLAGYPDEGAAELKAYLWGEDLPDLCALLRSGDAESASWQWTAKSFRPYTETLFPDEDSVAKAAEALKRIREDFRFVLANTQLERISFSGRVLTVDTSGLESAAVALPAMPSLECIAAYILNLLAAVHSLKAAGYGVEGIRAAWYIQSAAGKVSRQQTQSVILPLWKKSRFLFTRSALGSPALQIFADLKRWRVLAAMCLFLENLPQLLPLPVVPGTSQAKALFAGARTSVLPFLKTLEKVYWEVSAAQEVSAVQPCALSLLCEDSDAGIRFFLVKQQAEPLTCVSFETPKTKLFKIGEALVRAHDAGVGHLVLTPKHVKWDAGKACLTGFKHNIYRIVEKYVKQQVEPVEYEFLDPAVVSYIHWKRSKSVEAKRKREKYIRLIDHRCDVYGFAMLIYYELDGAPFAYMPTNNFEEFFRKVVKQQRRPLISKTFEEKFPQFTDALRRSWERVELRPSVKELLEQLSEFEKYASIKIVANKTPT